MQDNVAAEGIITLQDADWLTDSLGMKSARYNWTVDANNIWGMFLTANFWLRGGDHQFERSPNGKWWHIRTVLGSGHFIYVIQPGDEITRADGKVIDVTPGEDMMRISFDGSGRDRRIFYQYLVRRIAYLDGSGALIKTRAFTDLEKAVAQSSCLHEMRHCFDMASLSYRHLKDEQVVSFEEAPTQESMSSSDDT